MQTPSTLSLPSPHLSHTGAHAETRKATSARLAKKKKTQKGDQPDTLLWNSHRGYISIRLLIYFLTHLLLNMRSETL